jgi:hypothetical protein
MPPSLLLLALPLASVCDYCRKSSAVVEKVDFAAFATVEEDGEIDRV